MLCEALETTLSLPTTGLLGIMATLVGVLVWMTKKNQARADKLIEQRDTQNQQLIEQRNAEISRLIDTFESAVDGYQTFQNMASQALAELVGKLDKVDATQQAVLSELQKMNSRLSRTG